eukprot:1000390_1
MQLLILWVSFLLWKHSVHSQETVINGIWTDDFQDDPSKLQGWQFLNYGVGILDNPIVEGLAYRYHGPFTRMNDTTSTTMTRYFSCQRDSYLYLSFDYAYCNTEESDYVQLSLNGVYLPAMYYMGYFSKPFQYAEYDGTFENALPSDIDYKCDDTRDWYFESITIYDLGSMIEGNVFQIRFIIKTTLADEYAVLFNVEVECRGFPTTNPTTDPTMEPTDPTTPPSLAPTLAPSIAPSYRPGAPTNAPTLTDKYVNVRVTGCDFGNSQSIAWDYSY